MLGALSRRGRVRRIAARSRSAPASRVAEGVTLYRPDVTGVPDLPQPLAVQALALDPRVVELTSALALGRQQGTGHRGRRRAP